MQYMLTLGESGWKVSGNSLNYSCNLPVSWNYIKIEHLWKSQWWEEDTTCVTMRKVQILFSENEVEWEGDWGRPWGLKGQAGWSGFLRDLKVPEMTLRDAMLEQW